MTDRNRKMAERIAIRAAEEGGRTFYVGGYVRDRLRGIENKDIDIEVHGITPEKLAKILDGLGKRTEMGANFGIFGLRGYDLDIAMPRKEEATGRGHKDFAVYVDPYLGTRKAAMRRDFTMNALMEDVLTGKVIDHFGGIQDLEDRTLRHVNPVTFAEDPLRVLRAAQFAARFSFTVAAETVELSRTMNLSALARERVYDELKKALLKAERPSAFFEELRKMDQLSVWFPEVEKTIGVPQNRERHPEGDVWTHSMMVLDEAAQLKGQTGNPVGFMLAALTHDFGKILTTREVNGEIRAPGHAKEGQPLIRGFLERLTSETKLTKYVLNLDKLHMLPKKLAVVQADVGETNRMFDQAADPESLLFLSKADHLGRKDPGPVDQIQRFLWERLDVYRTMTDCPGVTGADLVAAGLKPGKAFSELLAYAHDLQLDGVGKEEALRRTLALVQGRPELRIPEQRRREDEC